MRVFSYVLLIASIWLLPWWVFALFLLISLFYFKLYFEGVLISFIYDATYSIPTDYFGGFEFVATVFTILFLLFFHYLKKRLFWTQDL